MRSRRAISPILAVMILIGITLVGGVTLSNLPAQLVNPIFSKLDYQISDFRLEKDAIGSCYFFLSLTNSGTETLRSLHAKTTLDNGEDWVQVINLTKSGLNPGNSTNEFEIIPSTNPICGNLTASNSYSFSINASSSQSAHNVLTTITIQNMTVR